MSVRHQWSHYTAATLHKRLCEKIKLTPWCDQKSFVKNINVESHIYLDLLERSLNATYPCIADATVHVLTKGYNLPCQLSVKLTCFYFFIVCDVPGNISKDIIQSSPSSKLIVDHINTENWILHSLHFTREMPPANRFEIR